MKVAVAVAAAHVPRWQRDAIAALRALEGVDVAVFDAPDRPPLRGIDARLGGAAMATMRVDADGDADALRARASRTLRQAQGDGGAGVDVVVDFTGALADVDVPGGVWSFRIGENAGDVLPFATEVARGDVTVDVALERRFVAGDGSRGAPGGSIGAPGGSIGAPDGSRGAPGGSIGAPGGFSGAPGGSARANGVLRRGRFPIAMWYPTVVRLVLGEAARWPATFVAALRDGVPLDDVPRTHGSALDDAPRTPGIALDDGPRTQGIALDDGRRAHGSALDHVPRTHGIALGAARVSGRAVRPRPASRVRLFASLASRFVRGMRDAFFTIDQWNAGFARGDARSLLDGAPLDVQWLDDPPSRTFVADPFVVERDGQRVLFLEDFNYVRDRGVIDALVLDDANRVVRRTRALETGVHLSYPYPLEIDGELYLVPESSAANEVALYRCVAFPDRWEREGVLLPIDGVDTTVFAHAGRWWALATRYTTGPSLALHAFHAPHPRGPWTPHALNPIVVDVTSARPAGTPFVVDGVLYRTGQDCSRTYGGAVAIARVDELTPHSYRETIVRRIAPPPGRFADGFHTIAFAGDALVVDGKRTYRDARNVRRAVRAFRARIARALARSASHKSTAPQPSASEGR